MSSWRSRAISLATHTPDPLGIRVLSYLMGPPDFTSLGIAEFEQTTPFMTAPFSRADWENVQVTEGWVYSYLNERRLHGRAYHGATDWRVPLETTVRAAVSGPSIAYYWSEAPIIRYGRVVKRHGFEVRPGGGLVVQTALPNGLFVRYCHLAYLADGFGPPMMKIENDPIGGLFHHPAIGHNWTYEKVLASPETFMLHQGQVLGYVGTSNCLYLGHPELHLEVFARPDPAKGPISVDPSGAYLPAPACLDPRNFGRRGPVLWRMKNGQIAFTA